MAARWRPAKVRGYAMSEAVTGGGAMDGGVCAATGAAALARVTCLRKVRRLVGIRYRVVLCGAVWGGILDLPQRRGDAEKKGKVKTGDRGGGRER